MAVPTDPIPSLSALVEALAEGIATAIVRLLLQRMDQPNVMVDVKSDPGVQAELQNDLSTEIAAGAGKLPA